MGSFMEEWDYVYTGFSNFYCTLIVNLNSATL